MSWKEKTVLTLELVVVEGAVGRLNNDGVVRLSLSWRPWDWGSEVL